MDSAAVVRRAVANREVEDAAHQFVRFVLHKQDTRHNTTQELIETPQGDVALLVAMNGNLLGPVGRQNERNRLQALDADPESQEHRHRREQEDTARVNNLLGLLPEAFLYHYESTVPCVVTVQPTVPVPGTQPSAMVAPEASTECYHMTFAPKPDWDPPNLEAKILRGMAGEIWIEKSNERLCRLNARLVEDVDFGWGIVGRLDKGGTIYLEQTKVADKDWELTRMKLNFTGKALMVKALNIHITEELGGYAPVPPQTDYHKAIGMLLAAQPGGK
jgi:hypothetical protein